MTLPRHEWPDLAAAVTANPEPADTIFRRYVGISHYKSLGHRLRRTRSHVGKTLQAMAEAGQIQRTIGDGKGHPIPVFWRAHAHVTLQTDDYPRTVASVSARPPRFPARGQPEAQPPWESYVDEAGYG